MSPCGRPVSMPPSLSASGSISVTPRSSHPTGGNGNVKRDPSVGWSSRRGRTERSDGRQQQCRSHDASGGQSLWGSTGAAGRWCSRSCRAATDCVGLAVLQSANLYG